MGYTTQIAVMISKIDAQSVPVRSYSTLQTSSSREIPTIERFAICAIDPHVAFWVKIVAQYKYGKTYL
jgi:hypothetical protein